jgi:hypothetical protein
MPKVQAKVFLWDFPRQDFPLWKKLCADEDDFETYDEYQAGLNRVAAMLKAGGSEVVWLDIPVANFMIMLAQRGLENTSANRAKVLEQIGQEQHGLIQK